TLKIVPSAWTAVVLASARKGLVISRVPLKLASPRLLAPARSESEELTPIAVSGLKVATDPSGSLTESCSPTAVSELRRDKPALFPPPEASKSARSGSVTEIAPGIDGASESTTKYHPSTATPATTAAAASAFGRSGRV